MQFSGPRSVIRVATFEDRFKLDDKSELDPSTNPLGDERTEGTGLESMTNLMSVDMLVGKIPNLTGNTLANIGGKFGQFFRRTSITPPEEPGARCTSPAEEAIIGITDVLDIRRDCFQPKWSNEK